jgi:hypothetical protein
LSTAFIGGNIVFVFLWSFFYFLDEYLSHMMPEAYWDNDPERYNRNENWRLVWPSDQYMRDIHQSLSAICNPLFSPSSSSSFADYPQEVLFFEPKTFALMEPDIQSQLYCYSCNTSLINNHRVPHIKSYTRVYHNQESDKKEADKKCGCYPVAWSVLTSACLSRGAQGEEKPYSICKECKHIKRVRNSHCFLGIFLFIVSRCFLNCLRCFHL